jgi:hypothetical protein
MKRAFSSTIQYSREFAAAKYKKEVERQLYSRPTLKEVSGKQSGELKQISTVSSTV